MQQDGIGADVRQQHGIIGAKCVEARGEFLRGLMARHVVQLEGTVLQRIDEGIGTQMEGDTAAETQLSPTSNTFFRVMARSAPLGGCLDHRCRLTNLTIYLKSRGLPDGNPGGSLAPRCMRH